MGRTRRRRRTGKSSGGALTSLRGGFRSAAHKMTGTGPARPASAGSRMVSHVFTVLLLLAAVVLVLRKFGFLRR